MWLQEPDVVSPTTDRYSSSLQNLHLPSYDPHQDTPIFSLPPQLLLQIATQLDRPTAINLAVTCTRLRPYGEAAAWRELNISVHRSFLPNPLPYNKTRPLGGNKLHTIRELSFWGSNDDTDWEEPTITIGQTIAVALSDYYISLIASLKVNQFWRDNVRTLYIDIDRLLCSGTVDLLRLTARTLTKLELIPPGFPYDPARKSNTLSPYEVFMGLSQHKLNNLRTLRLPLDEDWDRTAMAALDLVPNLKTLRLSANHPYSGSWGDKANFCTTQCSENDWPGLPFLNTLRIDEMSEELIPMLVSIIKSARDFRRIDISDPSRSWQPKRNNKLVETLGQLSSLKHIGCAGSVLPDDLQGAFEGVEATSIINDKQPDWGLPQLEMVSIPAFRSMKVLYSYAALQNESRSITWAWNGETRGLPAPVRGITDRTIQSLKVASSLLLIQFPNTSDVEWQIPHQYNIDEWSYWGSERCAGNHERGVLVRSYVNDQPGQEEFIHCRSFSAHHSHIDEGVIHRSDRVWEEHVDYQGRILPAGVLGEVYEMMGENAGWVVPGRGLKMPQRAWEVLRRMQDRSA